MQLLHRLSGASRKYPISPGRRREAALRSHTERLGPRLSENHRIASRAPPESGWQRHTPRCAEAVRRDRPAELTVRRPAPVTIATVAVAALLLWYVIYTQGVVRELRREASRVGLMYARVYDG